MSRTFLTNLQYGLFWELLVDDAVAVADGFGPGGHEEEGKHGVNPDTEGTP